MLACFESVLNCLGFVDVSRCSPWIYPAFHFAVFLRIGILRNAVNSLDVRDAKASSTADEASPCFWEAQLILSKWELKKCQHMIAVQHYVAFLHEMIWNVHIFVVCEDLIKRLILNSIGFDRVNDAVKLRLRQQLINLCLSQLGSWTKPFTCQREVSCAKHCHAMWVAVKHRFVLYFSTQVWPAPESFTTVNGASEICLIWMSALSFWFSVLQREPQQSQKCSKFGIGHPAEGKSTMSTFARVLLVLPALRHEFRRNAAMVPCISFCRASLLCASKEIVQKVHPIPTCPDLD